MRRVAIILGVLVAGCGCGFGIAQTPDGYLWFGTEFGLSRFDGLRSIAWEPPAGQHVPGQNTYSPTTKASLRGDRQGRVDSPPWHFENIHAQGGHGLVGDLRFTHLTTNDGLSQGYVTVILQDRRGFMWFATRDGLNRYDGNAFVVYKNNPKDPGSLSSNFIQDLTEDDHGYLWIATNTGVNKFDPITERFTRYLHEPHNQNSLGGAYVTSIARDSRGCFWFGMQDGALDNFNPATGIFAHYRNDNDGQFVGRITQVIEGRHQDIWFVSDRGLFHSSQNAGQITRPAATRDRVSADSVYEDETGDLWMLTHSPIVGLVKYDPRSDRLTKYPLVVGAAGVLASGINGGSLNGKLVADGQDGLWVPSSQGLYYFDRRTERFTYRFQHHESNPDGLDSDAVMSVYRDRSGVLWVGTENAGLNILNFRQEQFVHYRHRPSDPNSLSPGRVKAIYQDPTGVLWVGLYPRALNRLDRKSGQITHYVPKHGDQNALGEGTNIDSLYKDAGGYLWVGGGGSGLDRIDERTGRFKHYRHNSADPNSLISDNVYTIYGDRNGHMWVGGQYGLSRFDPATDRFTNYRTVPTDPASLMNWIWVIYQDRSGALWLGTFGGALVRFDDNTQTFVTYPPDSRDPHKLNGGGLTTIHEDRTGTLWVGGFDGLYRYNRQSRTFNRYTESQGLPSSTIRCIQEDGLGRLWLSTQKGMSRFDPKLETFRNYDVSDGLQSNEFSDGCYQSPDGELFFGGSNGFNAFFPENVHDNPYVSPVVVTSFKIFNKSVPIGAKSILKKAIPYVDSLTLSYRDNVFSFEFAALSYANSHKNRYRYKLEGLEPDWNEVDSKHRLATYTNLDPTSYVFRVQGSNSDGVWNEEGVSLPILITPPWWNTNWFRALCAAIFLALLWAAYQFRVRQLQRDFRKLRDVIDTIPAMAWTALPDGSNTFVNRRWAEYTGLSPGDTAGSGWTASVHPEDRQRYSEKWRASLANGEPFEFEARFCCAANGEYRWLLARGVPLRNEYRKVVRWYGTLTDIEDRKRAEETLREHENRFRTFVDHVADAILVQDEQGTIVDVNRQGCEGLGYTRQEVIGMTPSASFCLNADREAMEMEWLAQRTAAGEALFDRHWHRRKDGTVFPVEVHTRLFSYRGRRFLLKAIRDISESLRAEEAVRKSEKQLRDVIDTMPAYAWSCQSDGTLDFINQRCLEFSGFTFEQSIGPGWEAVLHPEDRRHFLEETSAALASGEPLETEARYRRADGQYRWLLCRCVPLRDETGTIVKWYGTNTDIDDRKRAEQALRRSEAYLAEAQRLTHTGSWAGDSTTAPLYWSEEVYQIFGLDPQHGLPTRDEPLQRIHPEDLDKFMQAWDRVIREKVDSEVEFRIVLPDGTVKHVHGIGHPVLNPNGQVVELVGTAVDITERKRAEQERERLRELEADLAHINRVSIMGELAASIAHEVNQPLSGVVSNGSACLRWLAGDVPNLDEARDAVRRIVRDGKRAGEVIARIRALTRRAAAATEKLDLNETIREVLALVGDEAKRKGVIIRTYFADDLAPVLGDRVQLQQVVLNLIMNGIEAMSSVDDRARELAISTRNVDLDQVQATVEDSGAGLDPNTIGRIFEPFYTTKSGGMGMGLSISRTILQAHGGRLWATPKDGPGTIFQFSFPKYRRESAYADVAGV